MGLVAVRCAWDAGCLLGEGPVWDARTRAVHFVDLKGGAVHSWSLDGGHRTWQLDGIVSALALTEAPDAILCATSRGFECLSLETGARTLISRPLPMADGMRTNDGGCDAQGNFWIGTMDDAERSFAGTLYRISFGQEPVTKLEGVGVSNGLGWSPDGSMFYFTDSLRRSIYRFDCDVASGTLGEKTLFAELTDGEGAPDGLTVDAEGHVWSAIWDGWRIIRYDPDGRIDQVVEMPVPRPTSLAFGGPDLATLYITTARIGLADEVLRAAPLSGALLALEPGVRGLAASRVQL